MGRPYFDHKNMRRISTMKMSLKKKKFNKSYFFKIQRVFPVLLTMALCICTVGTVQGQNFSTANTKDYMKITVENSISPKGAKVVTVAPNSYAQQAGIRPGNIITRINNIIISSSNDFHRAMAKISSNSFIDVGVIQNNIKVTRGVRVGNPPGINQKAYSQQKMLLFKNVIDKAPNLTITSLAISKNTLAQGAVFDISMDLFAENIQEKNDKVKVTMIYSVKKEGKPITAVKPEKLTLPNGVPVTIMRKCRARKEAGTYEVFIKLEMANVKAEKSVKFVVK